MTELFPDTKDMSQHCPAIVVPWKGDPTRCITDDAIVKYCKGSCACVDVASDCSSAKCGEVESRRKCRHTCGICDPSKYDLPTGKAFPIGTTTTTTPDPQANLGKLCRAQCTGPEACEHFCGEARYCCMKDDASGASQACKHAIFPPDAPKGKHICVKLDPAIDASADPQDAQEEPAQTVQDVLGEVDGVGIPPPGPHTTYVLGDKGTHSCPPASAVIWKADGCKAALKALKIPEKTILDGQSCYKDGAGDGHANGKQSSGARFVCQHVPVVEPPAEPPKAHYSMVLVSPQGPDSCKGIVRGPEHATFTANEGQPQSLCGAPEAKGAGCRCCGPASSQCASGPCTTHTFIECEKMCAAVGSRLCTEQEIKSGEARGTGCIYDAMHVWTSTKCEAS